MKNISLKVAGIFASFAFAVAAVPASAMTSAELGALLQSLGVSADVVAAVTAAQGGSTTSTPSASCPALTRDLTVGATGADVVALQTFLEAKGFLSIPAGTSKGYFGELTKQAVIKMQTANAISPAAGYVGPVTKSKIAMLCGTTTGGSTTGGSTTGSLSGGEASLENFDLSAGDDSDVSEGETAAIAEIEFDVEDGDIMLDRVDLMINDTDSTSSDPWDVFEELTLSIDGEEVGSVDLSDEDEYLDEDYGTVRISGIDFVAKDGETVTVVIEVTAQNSVDDEDLADWEISVLEDGIRATDGEGIQQYLVTEDESEEAISFDVEVEGSDDDLTVRSSSDDIDSSSLKVEDDSKSEWHDIFVFEIEAEESDMELNSVRVDLDTSATTTNMISDLILEIDGEEFDDWSFASSSATTSREVDFDIDGDFTIDADSEVTVVLKAEFKAANDTNYSSGETIQASIDTEAVDAEGGDDILSGGGAEGEVHTLLVAGLNVEKPVVDSDSEDGVGTFSFEIELTAFEEDVKIATSSAADGAGFDWSVVGGTAIATITVQSDADIVSGNYVIDEGSTETFTITITVDPASAGSFYVILTDVNYEVDGDNETHTFQPQSDYDTPAVSITAS